jgi:hypothetical protein
MIIREAAIHRDGHGQCGLLSFTSETSDRLLTSFVPFSFRFFHQRANQQVHFQNPRVAVRRRDMLTRTAYPVSIHVSPVPHGPRNKGPACA